MSPVTVALAVAAFSGAASPLPEIARSLPIAHPPTPWLTPAPVGKTTPPVLDKWVDAFPHVRINRALKAVEFDGTVAWDFHNADTPRTELELLVCLPMRDKEHESLVLSKAKGAHVHAALLMVGLEPGTPGRIDFGDEKKPGIQRSAPVGPNVSVDFLYTKNGKEVTDDARSWVRDEAGMRELAEWKTAAAARIKERVEGERTAEGNKRVLAHADVDPVTGPVLTFVFGGSKVGQMRNEQGEKVNVYNADEMGTLIGLCTFGGETIGITRVYSSDSGVDAPSFIANNAAIPRFDTPIRVRIGAVPPPAAVLPEEEETPDSPHKTPDSKPQSPPAPRP